MGSPGSPAAGQSGRNLLYYKNTLLILTLAFVVTIGGLSLYVLRLESRLVESIAASDASLYSAALREFRTVYTSEVVERARGSGTVVSHDYKSIEGAIPLPATLSIILGNRIGDQSGTSVRLYSDYPFPRRAKSGGPRDDFERRALEQLRQDPTEAVVELTDMGGRQVIRHATADLMRPSCVNCHNSHPDSPKTDWKEGDVRGVLEIVRPLIAATSPARAALRGLVGVLTLVVVAGLVTLSLFGLRLRQESINSARHAAETEAVNRDLEREIGERKRAEALGAELEKQVRHTQKLESVGLLAGGIAHDFNNMLMGILGNASLALEGLPDDSPARNNLLRIEKASHRASDLTHQLLVYAGKGRFERHPIDLSDLVREMTELLATAIGSHVELKCEVTDGLPAIEADAAQLQQVVMNLITNASDAIGAQAGTITVRTGQLSLDRAFLDRSILGMERAAGDYVFLEVEDTGEGIGEESRHTMFDPFFSTKSEGRGLGLAALQGIVGSHSGALRVDSELNRGTRFQVFFPADVRLAAPPITLAGMAPEARASGASAAPRSDNNTGCTVLVIDDEKDVREIAAQVLARSGFDVLQAATGEEGLELSRTHPNGIDAVLLDMRMPGMDGEATFQALRLENPALPIILSSGYGTEEAIDNLISKGRVAFLQKPYNLDSLLSTLGDLL